MFRRSVYPVADRVSVLLSSADRDGDGLSDLVTTDPTVLLVR